MIPLIALVLFGVMGGLVVYFLFHSLPFEVSSTKVPSYIKKVEENWNEVVVFGPKEDNSYFRKLGIGDDLDEALQDYRSEHGGSVFERERVCMSCGTSQISEASLNHKCEECGTEGNYLIKDEVK